MDPKIIGTIGLCFDIIGACLVAIEVVKVYRGHLTASVNDTWHEIGKPTAENIRLLRIGNANGSFWSGHRLTGAGL